MSDSGKHYPEDKFHQPMKTPDQVRAERARGGCCTRYCDNMACDCMENAIRYVTSGLTPPASLPSKPEAKEPSALAQAIRERDQALKALEATSRKVAAAIKDLRLPHRFVLDGQLYTISRDGDGFIAIDSTPVEILE